MKPANFAPWYAALAKTHRRDKAFIMDMIYMLDGPEQRAALAPFTMGPNDE